MQQIAPADDVHNGSKTVRRGSYGSLDYLALLGIADNVLKPRSYLEIGTYVGDSLRAFSCDAVSIDVVNQIELNPDRNVVGRRRRAFFFQMTSDEFFHDHRIRTFFPDGPDIAFLDGLHLFEYLLRDFINVERECHPRSIIFLHDCLPSNTRMAERVQRVDEAEDASTRGQWAGDVWRILPILKQHRPDLRVLAFDCPPTGLIACTNLDPDSDVLRRNYYSAIDRFSGISLEDYSLDRLWNCFPLIAATRYMHAPQDLTLLLSAC